MKAKSPTRAAFTTTRARNTVAAQLRNCRTLAQRFRLLLSGSCAGPDELQKLVCEALGQASYELDPNPPAEFRALIPQWRAELEARTGKLILPMLMAGDVGELVAELEAAKRKRTGPAPERDRLRLGLFAIGPGSYTWRELEARLKAYRAGTHDRRHIRRTWQELGLAIRILPGKPGAPRKQKPRTYKGRG